MTADEYVEHELRQTNHPFYLRDAVHILRSNGTTEHADACDWATQRIAELEKALSLLVADVADYPAWQRPCHALDVAKQTLGLLPREAKAE